MLLSIKILLIIARFSAAVNRCGIIDNHHSMWDNNGIRADTNDPIKDDAWRHIMRFFELFLIAVGLSMDAFAVSICKGLSVQKLQWKHYITIGLWFGGFQALMPAIGYLLGSAFEKYITSVDHWAAFILLAFIGGNMLKEGLSHEEERADASFAVKTMLLLAVATSIDALAVGITFGLLPDVHILSAVSLIGVTTFILSAIGLRVGNIFGLRYKSKAEVTGGIILILIGLKILLEHLGVIHF